jgi:ornithine cyclodeaminase
VVTPAEAIEEADIVVTTTPATSPILMADWLRPGQHVTAMGSDQHGKNELDPACIARADLYVADRLSQTRTLGELRSAIAAGLVAADAPFPELGAVVTGAAPGRIEPQQITIADLTGTGVQDTAIATLALDRAAASNAGTELVS